MATLIDLSKATRLRALNKSEIAQFFEVSLPTVESWIRRGCPVVERGSRGKAWVLDALDVAKWRFEGDEEEEQDCEPEKLQPIDRKAWYESEIKRRSLQVQDRELYQREEVLRTLTTTFAVFTEQVRAVPDRMEREAGITGEQAALCELVIDTQLAEAKKKILEAIQGE